MGRIQTTHVGSLPRSKQITDLVFAREAGVPIDEAGFNAIVAEAVNDIVVRQRAVGVDLPSDGEMSKISYATYIKDRLTGFEGDSPRSPPQDLADYPSFLERLAKAGGGYTVKDVNMQGIWLAQQMRSKFVSTISRGGIDGLFTYLGK